MREKLKFLAALYIISGAFSLIFLTVCSKIVWIYRLDTGGVGHSFWYEFPWFIWVIPFVLFLIGIYYEFFDEIKNILRK